MVEHSRFPGDEDSNDFLAEGQDPSPSEEDVLAELLLQQRLAELRQAGQAEPEEDLGVPEEEQELSERTLTRSAKDLRRVWTRLGLADPSKCTANRLRDLDPEVLLLLDEYTAEVLFFDTAKKVWGSLGSEPVYTELLLGQLQPPVDPAHPAKGIDLDKLRLDTRENAEDYLKELGVNEGQLRAMNLGDPQQQHNLVRLAYVLAEEPGLAKLRQQYEREVFNRVDPLDLVDLAKSIRNELKNIMFHYKEDLRRHASPNGSPMEYIGHLQFDRAIRTAESSLYLVEQVLAGWGIGKAKPGREAK